MIAKPFSAPLSQVVDMFRPYARSEAEIKRIAGELVNWFRIVAPTGLTAWRTGPDECTVWPANTSLPEEE